jgi:DNA-binding HxlR family transcriptional regulator
MPSRARSAAIPCAEGATGCEITDLFKLLGRAHVMRILYLFLEEDPQPHRFVDVQRRLGLSPNTLTERLKDLVDAGLLTRTAYNEIPPRVDYVATQKARELRPVFGSLVVWAKRNDLEPVAAPEPVQA